MYKSKVPIPLCIFKHMQQKVSTIFFFFGHRLCVQSYHLTWVHLPTPSYRWSGMTSMVFPLKWHLSDAWFPWHTYLWWPGQFHSVLQVNMKIWTSWFAQFCRVFWGKSYKQPSQVASGHLQKAQAVLLFPEHCKEEFQGKSDLYLNLGWWGEADLNVFQRQGGITEH